MQRTGGFSPQKAWFWVLTRPVFRAVDFHTSYVSASRLRRGGYAGSADRLAALDARKRELHRQLSALSATHGDACARCKGGCCTEERFRDSIVDRLLADPAPVNVEPRSLRRAHREVHVQYAPLRNGPAAPTGYCPNCTPQGCAIAPEDRPVQCLAYQCRDTISLLSGDELAAGIRAVTGLMGVMLATARAAGR